MGENRRTETTDWREVATYTYIGRKKASGLGVQEDWEGQIAR